MPLPVDQAHMIIAAATYVALRLIAAIRDVTLTWIVARHVSEDNQQAIAATTMKTKEDTAGVRVLRALIPPASGGGEPPAGA